MTVQIAVKLDDGLAERVKAASPGRGSKARRARAEEDARGPVYTTEQEAALMTARRRRAIAALDEQ
jgi:hypothetical protein